MNNRFMDLSLVDSLFKLCEVFPSVPLGLTRGRSSSGVPGAGFEPDGDRGVLLRPGVPGLEPHGEHV